LLTTDDTDNADFLNAKLCEYAFALTDPWLAQRIC